MQKVKRGACPKCCPNGGAIFDRAVSESGDPVWTCRNCLFELTRRVQAFIPEGAPASPSQARALERLRSYWAHNDKTHDVETSVIRGGTMFVAFKAKRWFDKWYHYSIGRRGKVKEL